MKLCGRNLVSKTVEILRFETRENEVEYKVIGGYYETEYEITVSKESVILSSAYCEIAVFDTLRQAFEYLDQKI